MPVIKELQNAVIGEEERAKLTAEELARLERYLQELKTKEYEEVKLVNKDRFDAKGMRPAGQEKPVRWKLVDEPPLPKK